MNRCFRSLRVLAILVAGASLAGCVAYPTAPYSYGHGHGGGYRSYAHSAPAYAGRGHGGGYGGGYRHGGHGGWRGGWR